MIAPIPRDIPDLPAIPGIPPPVPFIVPAGAVVAPARRPAAAAFRLLVALAAVAGVTIDLILGSPLRVLSYFSIQSNVVVAIAFAASAWHAWTARRPLPGAVTGGTLVYIVITGLVYHLILANQSGGFSMTGEADSPSGWQAVANQLLHTATPIAVLIDWLLLTSPTPLTVRNAATWVLYPVVYLGFSLARGAAMSPGTPDRYLYPFVDAERHGYGWVLGNAAILGVAFCALALLTVTLDHLRPDPVRRRVRRPENRISSPATGGLK
ncbi:MULTISPECIES: Pr6Pr family membrane protein [Streptomyces]|uniref:Integral membrane regulator n=1 Tax=Streptomyces dengpaensis TaxID=2049881 RepID=A0ABM6SSQ8_9ACTN|nr:Pr6Pr family membrane protein [Streptomyces sp. HG99]AVH57394.1 integral membrane regulator [Streptomyces dengpaensis]